MSNGLTSHTTTWNRIRESIMGSEVFTSQIKSYLKNAQVKQAGEDSLVLLLPNSLTKEFIDKSGILAFIHASFLDETGLDIAISTEVTSLEDFPVASPSPTPEPRMTPNIIKGDQRSDTDDSFSKYTFESFVVGASNQMARSAALAVAENPSKTYNPLFIYGKSGLGKTHLLIAIYNYIHDNYPAMKVLYFTARDLVDDIVDMSRQKNWEKFNQKYMNSNMLLIDDIQYLEGKEESIERVFQLLNAFITVNSKQIVLSADRSPRNLNMDERMTSRFMQGLPVDIQPPTFETKVAVLKNCRANYLINNTINDDVLEYIASISTSNIREIEGALNKIDGYLFLQGVEDCTVDLAREILRDYFPEKNSKKISISLIQHEVEKHYDITHDEMIGSRRSRNIVWPRQIAMFLARSLTEESYPAIGAKFGGRDHTTIMHGVDTVERKMKEERSCYDEVDKLSTLIKEKA